MKKEIVEIYENSDYIIGINKIKNKVVIKNVEDYTYYKIELEKFKKIFKDNDFYLNKVVKDNVLLFNLIFAFIIFVLVYYFLKFEYRLIDANFIPATVVMLINIPIHEIGHIVALKFFYKKSKVKLGFKFIFIYPAFFVDTSDSYLLPKYSRISVYLAGNLMNCIFLLIVMCFFKQYLDICYILFSNILINFLPIVKSDGYYALMSFFDKTNYFKSKKEEFIEDFIRGIIMFVFLYIFQTLVLKVRMFMN